MKNCKHKYIISWPVFCKNNFFYLNFTWAGNFWMVEIGFNMLDLLFFSISRLNNACSPFVINLQIN